MKISYETLCYFFTLALVIFIISYTNTIFEHVEFNKRNSYHDYNLASFVNYSNNSIVSKSTIKSNDIKLIQNHTIYSNVKHDMTDLTYDWIDQLLTSLRNEKLLKQNVLSKLELWKNIPTSLTKSR